MANPPEAARLSQPRRAIVIEINFSRPRGRSTGVDEVFWSAADAAIACFGWEAALDIAIEPDQHAAR